MRLWPSERLVRRDEHAGRWCARWTLRDRRISKDGGVEPIWSRDGKTLYFIAPDGGLLASDIVQTSDAIEASSPVKLFMTRIGGGAGPGAGSVDYAVARDGRFLISEAIDADAGPITIVIHPRF